MQARCTGLLTHSTAEDAHCTPPLTRCTRRLTYCTPEDARCTARVRVRTRGLAAHTAAVALRNVALRTLHGLRRRLHGRARGWNAGRPFLLFVRAADPRELARGSRGQGVCPPPYVVGYWKLCLPSAVGGCGRGVGRQGRSHRGNRGRSCWAAEFASCRCKWSRRRWHDFAAADERSSALPAASSAPRQTAWLVLSGLHHATELMLRLIP